MALIYVVEDDANIREIETIALKNGGHTVEGASCARELFEKIEEKVPDLAIVDIMLPDKDGYEIVKELRGNLATAHLPIIMVTAKSENEKMSMKNAYMQYDGNQPVIYGDSGMMPDAIKVLKTDAPFVADRIQELRNQIWNEAISFLGISNVAYQKKERMITDEVMRQMGGTIASRNSRLEARRQAAEEINEMFGTEIEVHFRENSENSEIEPWGDYPAEETEGGLNNE